MTDKLSLARAFAKERHDSEGQTYDGESYVVHLDQVVGVLDEFDICCQHGWTAKEVIRVAAYLHDVLEDTPTPLCEIFVTFGPQVAMLVFAVTNEVAPNRAERHRLTYPKIRVAGEMAVNLKLADRLANVRASVNGGKVSLVKMYAKEWPSFRDAFHDLGDGRMKEAITALLEGTG